MRSILFFAVVVLLFSCKKENHNQVTNPADYNQFLNTSNNETFRNAQSEVVYWSNRMKEDSSGVGELGPLARAYTSIFEITADVENLKKAEALFKKAMHISARNKDGYARALGRNYISQHRFKEARTLLEESYNAISNKRATELLLFDIYMELGEYELADTFLKKIKNNNDYNYLIRLSKWSDYKGNSDAALKYMEQAKLIAESRNSRTLKIWTYSNLADLYGHNGRIHKAYEHYLKTLEVQPDHAYSKKQIAWIAYAYEKNTAEARRILDSVGINSKAPELNLFRAELAEFEGDSERTKMYKKSFVDSAYGVDKMGLYATSLIDIYLDTDPKKALELAELEIENRRTPMSYSYLAMAKLKNGQNQDALQIIDSNVIGKTFEPIAIYHTAMIYKANGLSNRLKTVKKELLKATFELGPVISEKIMAL